MTYVVCRPCIGTKDRSCVEVCPVDCFYNIKKKIYNTKYGITALEEDDPGMLMIHPEECIHCGACETECPVEAIHEDTNVPEEYAEFKEANTEETTSMSDDELDASRCTSKAA